MTPIEVVQRQVEAFNAKDREAYLGYSAPEVLNTEGTPMSSEAAGKWYDAATTAVPDAQLHIDEIIEQGDLVVCRVTATGTHTGILSWPPEWDAAGQLRHVEPTGRTLNMTFASFSWVKGDKVVRDEIYGLNVPEALGLPRASAFAPA